MTNEFNFFVNYVSTLEADERYQYSPVVDTTKQEFIDVFNNPVTNLPPNLLIHTNGTLTDLDYAIQGMFGGIAGLPGLTPVNTRADFNNMLSLLTRKTYSAAQLDALREALKDDFMQSLGFNNPGAASELILYGASGYPLVGGPPSIDDLYNRAFDHFLSRYAEDVFKPDYRYQENPAAPSGVPTPGSTGIDKFIEDWRTFLTATATLSQAAEFYPGGVHVDSYQLLFHLKFPALAYPSAAFDTAFIRYMKVFIDQSVSTKGYFIPSHFIENFKNSIEFTATYTGVSTIAGTHSDRVLVILDLLKLIVDMIETLQTTATKQAERLKYLTDLQKAYTQTAANIPVFTKDFAPFSGTNEADTAARADANAKLGAYAENMRSFRSIIGDEAKQLQSNINQSNEAVNQQANLDTAILQQFSTILNSLFR